MLGEFAGNKNAINALVKIISTSIYDYDTSKWLQEIAATDISNIDINNKKNLKTFLAHIFWDTGTEWIQKIAAEILIYIEPNTEKFIKVCDKFHDFHKYNTINKTLFIKLVTNNDLKETEIMSEFLNIISDWIEILKKDISSNRKNKPWEHLNSISMENVVFCGDKLIHFVEIVNQIAIKNEDAIINNIENFCKILENVSYVISNGGTFSSSNNSSVIGKIKIEFGNFIKKLPIERTYEYLVKYNLKDILKDHVKNTTYPEYYYCAHPAHPEIDPPPHRH